MHIFIQSSSARDTIARRVIEKTTTCQPAGLASAARALRSWPNADITALGLQRRAGVIVQKVAPESAAARAGIVSGDVTTRVDDFEIAGTADLGALLFSLPAGQSINLRTIRDHKLVELTAVLGPRLNSEQRYLMAPFGSALQPALRAGSTRKAAWRIDSRYPQLSE